MCVWDPKDKISSTFFKY